MTRHLAVWTVFGLLLVALVFVVRRVDVGVPGTDLVVAFDFAGAYARPGWRLIVFLIGFAALMTWSARRYGRRPNA